MYRNTKRGIHGANTQGLRHHTAMEMDALGLLHPGSITLLAQDLNDPVIMGWLDGALAAGDPVHAFLRLLPPGPLPNPVVYGAQVARVIQAQRHRFYGFLAANEQNTEWAAQGVSLDQISQWNVNLWWQVRYYLGEADDFPLFYPPAAPGAAMSHAAYYAAAESAILNQYRRVAWHEYPWPGSDALVETDFPDGLLRSVRDGAVDSLISEWGLDPGSGARYADGGFIDQYVDRFGSAAGGQTGRSAAQHVCLWLLGSQDPAFEPFALVGPTGDQRQGLYDLAYFGP